MSMQQDFDIVRIEKPSLVKERVKAALDKRLGLLPADRSALVLIKPNFNSNFNALTGNTTDLRLLAAVLEWLHSKEYKNAILAEGSSGGFDRAGISVSHRLRADKLAQHYGIKCIDLNKCTETVEVKLENDVVAEVARVVVEADYVINMPKIKTHVETGMSVCLKNLIGACVGIANKRKMHHLLARNILRLNQAIKPGLHIVDGLIGMEGNGPTRGTPVNFGIVLIGTNPLQLDYICARLAQFPLHKVKTLAEAKRMGLITEMDSANWESFDLGDLPRKFKQPKLSPIAAFATSRHFQKALIHIRYAPVIRQICSTKIIKEIFYRLGVSQERIRDAESEVSLSLDARACNECLKCEDYCPMGLSLGEIAGRGGENCIHCLYCYSVCPREAIHLEGSPGFFADQIALYSDSIRMIA